MQNQHLSPELVFRGEKGKCHWIFCRINNLSSELVFRGPKQYCAHGSNKIGAFDAEFVLGNVPGKVR